MEKLYPYALDRKKTCSHAKFTATVIDLRFFMKKMKKKKINLSLFFPNSHAIFGHALTFLHVLHLDVLRRQIEIETESRN